MRPARLRTLVQELQVCYEVSERRVCQVLGFPRASHRYQSVFDERAELRMRLRELATIRVRYGYRRLHILLQREGWRVNHKLVYRLYCEEGLQMRIKTPRRDKSCAVVYPNWRNVILRRNRNWYDCARQHLMAWRFSARR